MRDLQDWYKQVELNARAVKRAADAAEPHAIPHAPASNGSAKNGHAPTPPRKGRGPRREETREQLLARLLDPTLTLEETACLLEVCPTTVRRYTNRGLLAHMRSAGNQRRFKLSDVLAFQDAQLRPEGGRAVKE